MSQHLPNLRYLDPELLQKLGDLDWRVFGRTERSYTKLYEAETTSRPLDLLLSEYLENRSLNMMGPSVGARA